jgi:mono/diheme cytochrome c family protein
VLLFVGCDFPGRPEKADRPLAPKEVTDFSALYRQNCAGCHGAAGKLGPAPPLDDPIFLAIVPDEELLRVISQGRPGTPMPGFARVRGGSLTAAQIKSLADGIKRHWRAAKEVAEYPSYLAMTSDHPAGDAEGVQRGAAIFAKACADCHGDNGKGSPDGETPGAVNDGAFLALISDQALRRVIITGRADLGMPSYADDEGRQSGFQPLTTGDIADLVALLSSWRNGSDSKGTN